MFIFKNIGDVISETCHGRKFRVLHTKEQFNGKFIVHKFWEINVNEDHSSLPAQNSSPRQTLDSLNDTHSSRNNHSSLKQTLNSPDDSFSNRDVEYFPDVGYSLLVHSFHYHYSNLLVLSYHN